MTAKYLNLATPGSAGLRPYIPGKPVEELERELGLSNTLKLASNENPLGPSPLGLAAAKAVLHGINFYPDDLAYRLRNKLADKHGIGPDQFVMGAGSSDVIDMVARTFLGPGRNAVFSEHAFAMYPIYTQAAGAEGRVATPLPADHPCLPFGHDLTTMLELVDEDTRVVFIANPNNPTGTWLTARDLEAFLTTLPEHVIVVLDEAYKEYVSDPLFPNGLQWIGRFPNLLVTRTFSKIYGLAGLRVGYGMAHQDLARQVNRVRHPFNVGIPALAAAEAALDDKQFIQASRENNDQGLAQLADGFNKMNLRYIPSVANFIAVDLARSGAEIYQALLHEGVIVRPVANYNLPHHLRITVGRPEENDRFIAALKKVLIL